jgi:hypothetical protein
MTSAERASPTDSVQALSRTQGPNELSCHHLLQDSDVSDDEARLRHGQVGTPIFIPCLYVDTINSMQACYVNTTHPDFINGHKAMAIVQERLNANKPQPPPNDPKRALNNNKDLDVEIKKEDGSFFGTFWSKAQTVAGRPATPVKKGAAAMEAVSVPVVGVFMCSSDISAV